MRITDLLPGGAEEAAKVTVLIDAKDQSVVSYSGGIFTIHKGTPGVTATIRKTNYADVKLTFVINEIDAEAQRVSNTGIVSGSVKEGFKLDGLKKGVTGTATQIKITKPVPGTKFEIIPVSDKAAQYVTCEEVKDGQTPNGVFQFTWKADATADVVYNIKADGYKAVTVTISATKLSKRALLEAFKAIDANKDVAALEVYGDNATLTLVGSTPVQLKLQIKEGDNDAKDLAYTYSDETGAVVKMEEDASGSNNAYTFTAAVTSTEDGKEPTLTIKYPGYEDATVKVKVVESAESLEGTVYLYNGQTALTANQKVYALENLVVGAATATDVTFHTTQDAAGTLATDLTVTPLGHDQEAVEVTVSGGKASFKAKKYVKGENGAQFTFKVKTADKTYATGTIKVTTASMGDLIDKLSTDSNNGFEVSSGESGKTAALALSVGNPVTIRFSDKIDIEASSPIYGTTGSSDATAVLTIDNLGGGYFKFTPIKLKPVAQTDDITFTLSADGYEPARVTVKITSLESFLTETTDPNAAVKLTKDSSAWKLTVPMDMYPNESGAIIKVSEDNFPANFDVSLVKTAGSTLEGAESDYAELSYDAATGKITITPKQVVAANEGLALRFSATGYGNFDVKVVFEENPMTLAGDDSATDVQYDLNTPNEPKTIAVPFDADSAGSYTFTAKVSSAPDADAITDLKVVPETGADGVTGISAVYSNGTVTIAVPAGTVRGTSQVITLKAKGYTPVEVTVSVQKEIVVTPPADSGDKWAPATKTLTIAAGDTSADVIYEFDVVGTGGSAIEGIAVDEDNSTDSAQHFTGAFDEAKTKLKVTADKAAAANESVTYTISAPGYETVEITLTVEATPAS